MLWNLNHRVTKQPIPPSTVAAISEIRPDILVLTEYVEGPSHSAFLDAIAQVGLSSALVSIQSGRNNRVLVASSSEVTRGPLQAPALDSSMPPNSLHAILPAFGLEVLGVRIPAFKGKGAASLRRTSWDWIDGAANVLGKTRSVLAGDLNTDPNRRGATGGARLRALVDRGWRHALPEDGYSWQGLDGRGHRIDHVFVRPMLAVKAAEYITRAAGFALVGNKRGFSSDHAALLVEFE